MFLVVVCEKNRASERPRATLVHAPRKASQGRPRGGPNDTKTGTPVKRETTVARHPLSGSAGRKSDVAIPAVLRGM
jgi:hypothetical protein